jgi:hypothetical protein
MPFKHINYIGTNKNLIISSYGARTLELCWRGPAEMFCYAMTVLRGLHKLMLCSLRCCEDSFVRQKKKCVIGHARPLTRYDCWRGPEEIHCYATLGSGKSWGSKYGSWVPRVLKPGMSVLARVSCNLPNRQRRPEMILTPLPESWDKIWSWDPRDPVPRMTVQAKVNSNLPDQTVQQELIISSHVLSSKGRRPHFRSLGMNKDLVISSDGTRHQE